ncbi:MAG: polyphosphate kinase 1 [Flavobacteriales bacterium]
MEVLNRELSWLSFNERVLQEAEDPINPLIERLRFLGIFSNNLDEFFKVRVASVKRSIEFGESKEEQTFYQHILDDIKLKTIKLQKRFDKNFKRIMLELKENNIILHDEKNLNDDQKTELKTLFRSEIKHDISPVLVSSLKAMPKLNDNSVYLLVGLEAEKKQKDKFAVIEIPSDFQRFHIIKSTKKGVNALIFIDDIVRLNLNYIFKSIPYTPLYCYAFKITRDAELDLDNDVSEGMLEKMKKGLKKRKSGLPVRLVLDGNMPKQLQVKLAQSQKINQDEHLIPGGRYHNAKDFISFPSFSKPELNFKPLPALKHPEFKAQKSLLSVLAKKDVFLHFPYQRFSHFIDLLQEAAIDPQVKEIKILVYRLAADSRVAKALVNAARNGKKVTVLIELKARFDEDNNIQWTNYLRERGVRVHHGFEGLKIHSKLCYIKRKTSKGEQEFSTIGTGNFNEKTAKIYGDFMLLTSHSGICKEVKDIFNSVEGRFSSNYHKHIVLSPKHFRNKLVRLINVEIKEAKAGRKAFIRLKMNSLVDTALIRKLYDASQAGVEIQLIVRGICRLLPHVKGLSDNIKAISILDRYLEHARMYYFYHKGEEQYYLSSADWMARNLDRRIELTCPIYDENIRKELDDLWAIQWSDNVKARRLDKKQSNSYIRTKKKQIRSQYAIYQYYKTKL